MESPKERPTRSKNDTGATQKSCADEFQRTRHTGGMCKFIAVLFVLKQRELSFVFSRSRYLLNKYKMIISLTTKTEREDVSCSGLYVTSAQDLDL